MSIGRDTGYNLAAAVAPALFTLVTVPFYLHQIGPDRFGILAICWTLISAVGFASLGMGPALVYRLALMGDEPAAARSSIVWTALAIALAASIAGSILVVAVGEFYFRYLFAGASGLNSEIWQALPLLAAQLPLAIAIGVLNGALQGSQRFGAFSALSILNAALLALVPLAMAYFVTVELDGLILATVVANVVVVAVGLIVCARIVPLAAPTSPRRSDAKALIGYGSWISATALIAPVVLLIDRLVIGALRGPAAVAVYVLPYGLVQQLVLLPASLVNAIIPRFAPLPEQEVEQLQSSSLRALSSLITPLAVVAIALSAPFLNLWIGPTLSRSAIPVAVILLFGAWIHGIAHVPAAVLLGRRRPEIMTKLLLGNLLPYLAILYVATSRYGVVGAAAAWTIRAAFDPILFLFTHPRRSDMWGVLISAIIVLAAVVTALMLTWTTLLYWVALALLALAACYQHRTQLMVFAGKLPTLRGNVAA